MTRPSAPDTGNDENTAGKEIDQPRSSDDLARDRTDLAYERTRLAVERTSMGYMRTSIALIGFGFSIPTFFRIITDLPGFEDMSVTRPRILGLSLLLLAVVMLATSISQQVIFLRRLAKQTGKPARISITLLSSIFVLLIAISAIVQILMRIGMG